VRSCFKQLRVQSKLPTNTNHQHTVSLPVTHVARPWLNTVPPCNCC
jgi:hypothetical protein